MPALKEIVVHIYAHGGLGLMVGLINITGAFSILKKIGFSYKKSNRVERAILIEPPRIVMKRREFSRYMNFS